ncbi:MAG: RNA polymerase sigma-70 factor [Bacteroidota bacterium]
MTTDHELWDRIRENNEQAFATLFYRYSSKIYSTAYSYIRNPEVCEQIVQDIFISLWTNRHKLDIQSFKSYLTSASRYRVYKHMTACKVIPLVYKENLEDHLFENYSTQNEAHSNLACEELQLEVDSCLQTLPKRCREIFVMSRTQDLSNDQIAAQLGISKRTVENQITYALRQLRYSLKDVSVLLIILEGLNQLRP